MFILLYLEKKVHDLMKSVLDLSKPRINYPVDM